MKVTKIIITCDLCGNEIDEAEAATLTLPSGITYDICPDCVKRIFNLVDEPITGEPKAEDEVKQEAVVEEPVKTEAATPKELSYLDAGILGAKSEAVRKKLKMSRLVYASKLGVAQTTLFRIEHNDIKLHRTKKVQDAIKQIEADYDWHCANAR